MNSILQWNMNSYKTKFAQLKVVQILLNKMVPMCVCLQETLHATAAVKPPSGYNIVATTPNPNGQFRGLIILVHTTVKYKIITLNTNKEAIAVQIYLNKTYTICNIYLLHVEVNKNEITHILDQIWPPFLVLGDMNAKSSLWWTEGYGVHTNGRQHTYD